MRERLKKGTRSQNLAGSLLLAHPALSDPNFRRTVILMSAHNGEGAMGMVLNRPLGRLLGELNVEFSLGPLALVPVFCGGPVQPEQLILAAWQIREDGFKLHLGIEPDKAVELAGEEGAHVRAFLGYSGWSGGQLEGELKRNTWVVSAVPGDLMRHPQDEALWRVVLGGVSLDWRLLVNGPDDASLN
jgi:putative transcriptional regulator